MSALRQFCWHPTTGFLSNSRNDRFGRLLGPFRGVPGCQVRPKIQNKSKFLTGTLRQFRWYPTTWVWVGVRQFPFWEAAGTLWMGPVGTGEVEYSKSLIILNRLIETIPSTLCCRFGQKSEILQKFGMFSLNISGIQGLRHTFGLHSKAGEVVNVSKRCSNDLRKYQMPCNRSRKPLLAFF